MAGMNVYGELIRAQLERLSADPSSGVGSRIFWNTTEGRAKFDNGSAIKALLANDDKLLLGTSGTAATNIRLNRSGVATLQLLLGSDSTTEGSSAATSAWAKLQAKVGDSVVDTSLVFQDITTPSNPPSGYHKIYCKSTGTFYTLDSAGVETAIGTGTGGGGTTSIVNYVTNPYGTTDTSGWNGYTDSGATPVDGTGSPSVNFAISRNTTSPLRGTSDLLISKATGSQQGKGVSTDLAIQIADYNRLLKVSFNYKVNNTSGTAFAAGDLGVYLISDTSGTPTLVTPTSPLINTTTGKFEALFNTNGIGSWRMCIHCVSTATGVWTMQITDVFVGPQNAMIGPVVSDDETVTMTSAFTNTTVTAKRRRVGGMAFYTVRLEVGGAVGASALTLTLPTGDVIDTARLPGTADGNQVILGEVYATDVGSSRYDGAVRYSTTTAVQFSNDGNINSWSGTVPFTPVSGDFFSVTFAVPIVGWSSNTVFANNETLRMSTVAMTRTTTSAPTTLGQYRSYLRQAAASTYTETSGTPTATPNITDGFRLYSGVTYAAGDSASSPSRYEIFVGTGKCVQFEYYASAAKTGFIDRAFRIVSTSSFGIVDHYDPTTGIATVMIPAISSSTTALNAGVSATGSTLNNIYFDVVVGSAPNSLAISKQVVWGRYSTSAAPANTGTLDVDYSTTDYETQALKSGSGSSWRWTAPFSGKLTVTVQCYTASGGGWGVGESYTLYLHQPGVVTKTITAVVMQAAHTTNVSLIGTITVDAVAGNAYIIRMVQDSGASLALYPSTDLNWSTWRLEAN
jgi:hypothetical protein